jgi:hypothetical protein
MAKHKHDRSRFRKGYDPRRHTLTPAERAGFGNARTYEQAKQVVEHGAPELVEKVDSGAASISAAARERFGEFATPNFPPD